MTFCLGGVFHDVDNVNNSDRTAEVQARTSSAVSMATAERSWHRFTTKICLGHFAPCS